MIDDFESQEVVRSSGELWSEICSSLPEAQTAAQTEATPGINTEFKDSFQPAAQVGVQVNGQSNGTNTSSTSAKWEPMEDSEIYIASLGADLLPEYRPHDTSAHLFLHPPDKSITFSEDSIRWMEQNNRLKKLKGQSSDVTSRDMLRSLSQAKKECWDRFLHDAQTSELFQGGDMDESALEHFKRWLIPEKVAISAEELEYLLRPSQSNELAEPNQTQNEEDTERHNPEEDDAHSPEK